MAQSREKRNRRSKQRPATVAAGPSPEAQRRAIRRRRMVLAFLLVVGLAGVLAIVGPDGADAPGPPSAPLPDR